MNGIGYKIKKTILYILLILLSVVCMFPLLGGDKGVCYGEMCGLG